MLLENSVKEEMDNYLKALNVPHSTDPALYWKQTFQFPNLKKLALKYLSLKPASVDSERVFSTAGLIQSDRRNRLKPEMLQMLCFLNKNLKEINYEY